MGVTRSTAVMARCFVLSYVCLRTQRSETERVSQIPFMRFLYSGSPFPQVYGLRHCVRFSCLGLLHVVSPAQSTRRTYLLPADQNVAARSNCLIHSLRLPSTIAPQSLAMPWMTVLNDV